MLETSRKRPTNRLQGQLTLLFFLYSLFYTLDCILSLLRFCTVFCINGHVISNSTSTSLLNSTTTTTTTTTAREQDGRQQDMYSIRSLRAVSSSASRVGYRGLTRSFATTRYQQQSSSTSTPSQTGAGSPNTAASKSTDRAAQIVSETPNHPTTANISKTGLSDKPLELETSPEEKIDWTRSFHGLSAEPFPKEAADVLLAPTDPEEVEIKPDGILYLPEIKYRRILNRAFGPGGWGLVPRSESIVTPKTVTREYALVCNGRCVSPPPCSCFLPGFDTD